MNTQRITISLPDYLYRQVTARVKSGGVSKFVAKAVEDKLLCVTPSAKDAVEEFMNLRKKLPKLTRTQIRKAIERGRA